MSLIPEQSRHAFSFVEVVVGILILAIGIIPVFSVFSRGNQGTQMTRDEILAHLYASEIIDYAQACGYSAPELTPETSPKGFDTIDFGGGIVSKVDSRFSRTMLVEEKWPSGELSQWPVSYKILTVEIVWTSSGVSQRYIQTGLLYRGESPRP